MMNKILALLMLVSAFGVSAFAADENMEATDTSALSSTGVSPEFDATQPLHEPTHFRKVVCYSEDHHGYRYSAVGYDAHQTQHEAHHSCEYRSHGDCYDLGCRYY